MSGLKFSNLTSPDMTSPELLTCLTGVPQSAFDDLLRLDLTSGSEDFAVDFRDTAVNWLNDIERDGQYAKWPSSVTDLLRPTYPGMLRTVRKNMYHLVSTGWWDRAVKTDKPAAVQEHHKQWISQCRSLDVNLT